MQPRTSVIMPVYGTEASVVRAMESVLKQTDTDFELLIINDRTPDDADRVITEYLAAHPDSRVRYMTNPRNIGLAATRNNGMAKAHGQWLAFLDSDDAYEPHFLETMHAAVTEQTDIVVCRHEVVHEDGTRRIRRRGDSGTFTGEEAMNLLLRDLMTPYAWDKIFRVSALEGLEFPIINRVEDAAFCIPAADRAHRVRVIDDSLVLYSVNPQSITWGSVPPVSEGYAYVSYLKEITGAHRGSVDQQKSLATTWTLFFLNSAQSALRLQPDDLDAHLRGCQKALRGPILWKCLLTRPIFGVAGYLLKISPWLYKTLYGAYIRRAYGL